MRGLGIVTEYNPFHNGHSYHIQASQQHIQPDFTVAIMSGNWVQRGEPAIIDKWSRAKMALQQGVDLVIELPFIWATQSAQEFAQAAVAMLIDTKSVTDQTFGSETGDLNLLTEAATLSIQEPTVFQNKLSSRLQEGMSYSQALAHALGLTNLTSNDILGIEYLKAHKKLNSTIQCHTVKRMGSDYNEHTLKGKYSSATSIRNKLRTEEQNITSISQAMPQACYTILAETHRKKQMVFWHDLESYILYKFKITNSEQLTSLIEWEPGLEKRLCKAALGASSLSDFTNHIKTKRYTRTRLNRLIIHNLFDLTKHELNYFNASRPPYLRVLGMNDIGKKALKNIADSANLPILTRPAKQLRHLPEISRRCFQWEVIATSFYNLLTGRDGREEYTRPPVIIGN